MRIDLEVQCSQTPTTKVFCWKTFFQQLKFNSNQKYPLFMYRLQSDRQIIGRSLNFLENFN